MKKNITAISLCIIGCCLFYSCKTTSSVVQADSRVHSSNIDVHNAKSIKINSIVLQEEFTNPVAAEAASYFDYCFYEGIKESNYYKIKEKKSDIFFDSVLTEFSSDILQSKNGKSVKAVYMTVEYSITDKKGVNLGVKQTHIHALSDEFEDEISDSPTEIYIIRRKIPVMVSEILEDIQPYDTTKRITLITPQVTSMFNKPLQKAYKQFKNGEYSKARDMYKDLYDSNGLFEAGYNAARIMQIRGELDDAYVLMKEIFVRFENRQAALALEEIEKELLKNNKKE